MKSVYPHCAQSLYAVYQGVDSNSPKGARSRLVKVCTSRTEALKVKRDIIKKHCQSLRGGSLPPPVVVIAYDHRNTYTSGKMSSW